MRLAFYSPFNPVSSGIADYAEELLPLLARQFNIELVVDGYTPTNPALSAFPVHSRADFMAHARDFDLVLYQMGNSPIHTHIFETLLQVPGVVVMHDVVLHHLRAWQTLDRRDVNGYVRAMRADYGEAGAELARLEAEEPGSLDRFAFPLNGEVVRAARAVIVHSASAAQQIQPLIPQTPVAAIPMGVPSRPVISGAEARARLNLPADAFVVGVFGEIHPHKRVTPILQVWAEFHARFPKSLLILIGRESANYQLEDILHELRLHDAVRLVGFAPRAAFEDYIAAADACLNLRYPTAGETSASLLRLFAAGKAVIVTRTGAYAELPDHICAKIEPDEYEPASLYAHLEFFQQRPDVRAALGAHAYEFAAQGHTLERSASAYVDFLNAVYEGRADSRSYLRRMRDDASRKETAARRKIEIPDQVVVPSFDLNPPPPLTPGDWRDSIARAYAELGLDAEDATLRSVAEAIVELGLNQEGHGG